MEATNHFHEQMRLFFYPKIFEEIPVNTVDWQNIQVQYFSATQDIPWTTALLPLILLSSIAVYYLGWGRSISVSRSAI